MCDRNEKNPFFIKQGNRAMVSLGPLTIKQHCSYRCAFCYVQDGFCSYMNYSIDKILDFLLLNKNDYNIVYISGDTDSFAPPRTQMGLSLLYRVSKEINCDLLFTTRTTFEDDDYKILQEVATIQKEKNKELFGCISITRYSETTKYLEPSPIPTPEERISVLKRLHEMGITTVLAMRPFLPMVCINDYLKILDLSHKYVDIALGEYFYFLRNDKIQKRVFINGILPEYEKNISKNNKMDFDNNDKLWDIWYSPDYEKIVKEKCDELNIIFSMHSDDAIQKYKNLKITGSK